MYNPYWNFVGPSWCSEQDYRGKLYDVNKAHDNTRDEDKFCCFNLGDNAPDFALDAIVDKERTRVSLGDYLGKWVLVFFYGSDFTFV